MLTDPKTLGVLVDPKLYRDAQGQFKLPMLRKMGETASEYGLELFIVTHNKIKANGPWEGLVLTDNGWADTRRLPSVFYDRAFSAPERSRAVVSSVTAIKRINERIGYWKWDVHTALAKAFPYAEWLLPARKYTDLAGLGEFLKFHGMAVVKPSRGLKALGLVRLEIKQDGTIDYAHRDGKIPEVITGNTDSLSDLPNGILSRFNSEEYVMQKGIWLSSVGGHRFDIRALCQKDSNGEWQLILKAHVAKRRNALPTGGRWIDGEEAVKRAFQGRDVGILVRNTALDILASLDSCFARAGELGLDLAVSTMGRVFFIEANSMPGRDMYTPEEYDKVSRRPVEYASFLARN